MKKIFMVISMFSLILSSFPVCGISEDQDSKLLYILNHPQNIKDKWSPDPSVKILKMTFVKKSSDQWSDIWEVSTTLKSCYKTNVHCTINGYFEYTDDEHYDQRESYTIFFGSADKESISTGQTLPVKISKNKINYIKTLKIRTTCEPIYSEHQNKYPPNHKYWKQFSPRGKCE